MQQTQSDWQTLVEEMRARLFIVVDDAGHLLEVIGESNAFDTLGISSLSAATLAALAELKHLTHIDTANQADEFVLLEGPNGTVLLGRGVDNIAFIAVLAQDAFLGMARLLFKQILQHDWGFETPMTLEDVTFSLPEDNDMDEFSFSSNDPDAFDLDALWNDTDEPTSNAL